MPGWRTVVRPAACSVLVLRDRCCNALVRASAAGEARQRHETLRSVDELTVQAAVGIPRDAAAVGLWRLLGDASSVASAAELTMYSWPPRTSTTGVRRRDLVEVVAQRQTLFAELRFVPVAVRQDDPARCRRSSRVRRRPRARRRASAPARGRRPGRRRLRAGGCPSSRGRPFSRRGRRSWWRRSPAGGSRRFFPRLQRHHS